MSKLSYPVEMWGGLDVVQKHESDVRSQMDDARAMVQSRAQCSANFGQSMISLGAGGPGVEWTKAVSGSHRKGEDALKQSTVIETELVAPLKKWITETKPVVDDLAKKASELKDRFEEHKRNVNDTQVAYHAQAEKAEKAMREFEWAEKNKLLDSKERKKIESAWREKEPQWKEAEAKHQGAVEVKDKEQTGKQQ
jgi:hypothetical protein